MAQKVARLEAENRTLRDWSTDRFVSMWESMHGHDINVVRALQNIHTLQLEDTVRQRRIEEASKSLDALLRIRPSTSRVTATTPAPPSTTSFPPLPLPPATAFPALPATTSFPAPPLATAFPDPPPTTTSPAPPRNNRVACPPDNNHVPGPPPNNRIPRPPHHGDDGSCAVPDGRGRFVPNSRARRVEETEPLCRPRRCGGF